MSWKGRLKKGLWILLLGLIGCGVVQVEGRWLRPPEATATVQARRALQETAPLGWLAYIQDGDLHVKALPDGQPRRLTDDGRNREPRWSPSGRWLAFRKGEDELWAISPDAGVSRRIDGRVGAFVWSPITDTLAYVLEDRILRLYHPPTGRIVVQWKTATGRIGGIAWQPGGQFLAMEYEYPSVEGQPGLWEILLLSADGSSTQVLFQGDGTIAGWTPDGRFLFLWNGLRSAPSIAADGVPVLAVAASAGPGGGASAQLVLPDFSLAYRDFIAFHPAETLRLAFVMGGGRETWRSKALWVGQLGLFLEGQLITPPSLVAISPAWSPDGQQLAFVGMPDSGGQVILEEEPLRRFLHQRRIYVYRAGQIERLTDDPFYRDEYPQWSADGRFLLFARLDHQSRASLWLIPAEGGTPRLVVESLSPSPGWLGNYGRIGWEALYDWWKGPPREERPPSLP